MRQTWWWFKRSWFRWRDDFEVLQKLVLFSAADRRGCFGWLAVMGSFKGKWTKDIWGEKMAKKDRTKKVKWEFNSANSLRAGKVANWQHQKNINSAEQFFSSFFLHLFHRMACLTTLPLAESAGLKNITFNGWIEMHSAKGSKATLQGPLCKHCEIWAWS